MVHWIHVSQPPDGILIGPAVFAQLTRVPDTHRQTEIRLRPRLIHFMQTLRPNNIRRLSTQHSLQRVDLCCLGNRSRESVELMTDWLHAISADWTRDETASEKDGFWWRSPGSAVWQRC